MKVKVNSMGKLMLIMFFSFFTIHFSLSTVSAQDQHLIVKHQRDGHGCHILDARRNPQRAHQPAQSLHALPGGTSQLERPGTDSKTARGFRAIAANGRRIQGKDLISLISTRPCLTSKNGFPFFIPTVP